MASKRQTRAQDLGVSTKSLRRMARVRIERMRNAIAAIEQAWCQLDDPLLSGVIIATSDALDTLEADLAGIAEYHEQPVGEG